MGPAPQSFELPTAAWALDPTQPLLTIAIINSY